MYNPVSLDDVVKNIGVEIFDYIYCENKFKYNNRYHFDFNKTIDDWDLTTSKSKIGVRIITSYYNTDKEFTELDLKMMSARENSLIIKLPPDTAALTEMEAVLKLRSYLTRDGRTSATLQIEDIKNSRDREVAAGKQRVRSLLLDALNKADFYANSQKVNLKSKNPVERINNGLKELIDGIYSKLNYITSFIENSKDLHDILQEQDFQLTLVSATDDPNKRAMEEVREYIAKNTLRNIPVSMKTLLTLYSKAPYGWLPDDIRALVLRLFKSQEIMLKLGEEYLAPSDKNLVQYISKKQFTDKLLIKQRTKTPEQLLSNARHLIKDVFKVSAIPSDEDSLIQHLKALARNELAQVNRLLVYYEDREYPDKKVLLEGKALFQSIPQFRNGLQFFENLYAIKEELLAYAENIVYIKKFFETQRGYFDRALHHLDVYNKNKSYVLDGEIIRSVKELETVIHSTKPYGQISRLPALLDAFRKRFVQLLEKEIEPVRGVIDNDRQKVSDELDLYPVSERMAAEFHKRFKDLLDRLEACNNFYEAIAMKEESDRLKLRCFEEIEKKKQEHMQKESGQQQPELKGKKNVINISIANIFHGARTIETEEDLEQLLHYLRQQLKNELKENTRLKLI